MLIIIWGHNEEEPLFFLFELVDLSFTLMNIGGQVTEKLEFRLGRIQLSILNRASKSITHDGDQHVKHGDLSEQCSYNEEEVAHTTFTAAIEVIQIELAEDQQVLVDQHIWDPEGEPLLNQREIISAAAVEHGHWDAKHHQANEE